MSHDSLFILLVALLTWAGVLAYLMRVERLVRQLEAKVTDQEAAVGAVTAETHVVLP